MDRRPRVHVLTGTWTPQLSFYDRRRQFLTHLEELGVLLRFRMPDDSVEASIADVGLIHLGPGHIRLEVGSPSFDDELLHGCLTHALASFSETSSDWRVLARYIIPVDAEYEVARALAIQNWLQPPLADDMDDIAVLIDGRDPATNHEFQIEFGIVSRAEAQYRLQEPSRVAPEVLSVVNTEALPLVGTFLDWGWRSRKVEPMNFYAAAAAVLDACLTFGDARSAIIHNRYKNALSNLGAARKMEPS